MVFSELYNLMINHNVVLDATMSVLVMYKNHPKMIWRYEIGKRIIQQAHKKGVLIAAGSDSDQSTFVQHEMKLLVNECGFSPSEALENIEHIDDIFLVVKNGKLYNKK